MSFFWPAAAVRALIAAVMTRSIWSWEFWLSAEDAVSETTGGRGRVTGSAVRLWFLAQEADDERKANAELKLVAPADQLFSGDYAATVTSSLFEY